MPGSGRPYRKISTAHFPKLLDCSIDISYSFFVGVIGTQDVVEAWA